MRRCSPPCPIRCSRRARPTCASLGAALPESSPASRRRPVTRDGRWITLLTNAATTVEIRAGLEAEADGVGLLRTELAFLEAQAWPSEDEHVRSLSPLLRLLRGRPATVRVLDFGSDKTP